MDIEICIDNIESALIAQNSGADRLEVCGCLALGGVTPPYSLIKTVLDVCNIPCYVMIRPRSGDFLFNAHEIKMMEQDIHIAKQLGAQGVVIGALTENGEIDLSICHRLISAAEGLGVTFHRAFDLCSDPYHGLEQLIELGCERVLTSGQQRTAFEGRYVLKTLVQQAKGRIKIMAGAGVNPNNALELVKTSKVDELHLSAKTFRQSSMKGNSSVTMGNKAEDDYKIWTTDRNQIIAIKKLFQE